MEWKSSRRSRNKRYRNARVDCFQQKYAGIRMSGKPITSNKRWIDGLQKSKIRHDFF